MFRRDVVIALVFAALLVTSLGLRPVLATETAARYAFMIDDQTGRILL